MIRLIVRTQLRDKARVEMDFRASERNERAVVALRSMARDRRTRQVRSVAAGDASVCMRAYVRSCSVVRVQSARKREYPRECTRCPGVVRREDSHYLRPVTRTRSRWRNKPDDGRFVRLESTLPILWPCNCPSALF